MIQKNRSANSKSFLRELEFTLFLIEDGYVRNNFLQQGKEVFKKRNDPNTLKTGEKDLKVELLSYLRSFGDVKTANIWARNIVFERNSINELLGLFQQELSDNGIQGILEIHLQDREINSPHIQFIGNNAEEAESIIADILVRKKYEYSYESALSKKSFKPYYKINPIARTGKLDQELKKYESHMVEFDELDKEIQNTRKLLQNLKTKRIELSNRMKEYKEFRNNLRNKTKNLKMKKLRRRVLRPKR